MQAPLPVRLSGFIPACQVKLRPCDMTCLSFTHNSSGFLQVVLSAGVNLDPSSPPKKGDAFHVHQNLFSCSAGRAGRRPLALIFSRADTCCPAAAPAAATDWRLDPTHGHIIYLALVLFIWSSCCQEQFLFHSIISFLFFSD